VTQAQWQAVMGTSVKEQRNKAGNPTFAIVGAGPDYPMYYVSWQGSQEFVQKVNALGMGVFRLPSEAEWEYACRAGTQTRYGFGDNDAQLGDYAWYGANSGQATHPVGQKQPNAFGIYDMHGNVWEWCQDWYHETYAGAPTDGTAWETPAGQYRVLRGGALNSYPEFYRSASRNDVFAPVGRIDFLGFRLLRTQF
jgi:formylglycine-generating enzyme required for sulfatase activity